MVVGTPHEHDGVANGRVEGEGHVAENTLSGSNDDSMGYATPRVTGRRRRGARIHGRWRSILGHTF